MLKVGDQAPDFELPATPNGDAFRLSRELATPVLLYFYPKDMTPGCTTQACDFRDRESLFAERGVRVVGISPDSIESHNEFIAAHQLPITLLSDPDHAVADRFGVWVEKNLYGRKSMGIQRATFLIDRGGRIAAVWPRVRAAGHADAVLKKLILL